MAITYRIDEERGVILTTATGVLTDAELIGHKKKIMSDPAVKPGMVELADVRAVERLDVTSDGNMQLALMDQAANDRLSGSKLAIVASTDVVFGMARMYEIQTSDNPLNVAVFRDMDLACEWLGIARVS